MNLIVKNIHSYFMTTDNDEVIKDLISERVDAFYTMDVTDISTNDFLNNLWNECINLVAKSDEQSESLQFVIKTEEKSEFRKCQFHIYNQYKSCISKFNELIDDQEFKQILLNIVSLGIMHMRLFLQYAFLTSQKLEYHGESFKSVICDGGPLYDIARLLVQLLKFDDFVTEQVRTMGKRVISRVGRIISMSGVH